MKPKFKICNPDTIRAPFGNYVHGISVPSDSAFLFTSGQLGTSKDDATPDSAEAQARICFQNIEKILSENNFTFRDVVKVSAFVTDRDYFPAYMSVRDEFIKQAVASTLIVVNGFTRPEFKVEVEIIAAH